MNCPTAYLALLTSLPPASPESWRCCSRLHHAVRHPPYGLASSEVLRVGPHLPSRVGCPVRASLLVALRTAQRLLSLQLAKLSTGLGRCSQQAKRPKSQLCFRFKPESPDARSRRACTLETQRQAACLAREGKSRASGRQGRRGLRGGGRACR